MSAVLLNETNTRPATIADLNEGDLFIFATDAFLKRDGASFGYTVYNTHVYTNTRWLMTFSGGRRAVGPDQEILLWTGGPVDRTVVSGKYVH